VGEEEAEEEEAITPRRILQTGGVLQRWGSVTFF